MYSTFSYIPEKNVFRAYNVGAGMYLQFLLNIILFSTRIMFCTVTLALSEMCAVSNMAIFVIY